MEKIIILEFVRSKTLMGIVNDSGTEFTDMVLFWLENVAFRLSLPGSSRPDMWICMYTRRDF